MSIGRREDDLYATFQAIVASELPHVCVGGLAVSAFLPRATLDIDLVIPSEACDEYRDLLADHGYEFTKDYESSGMYGGEMIQFRKEVSGNSIEVELLVDALGCRQTDAEWGYDYLHRYSTREVIRGTRPENELATRIAEPELLVALKLHSGRPQDARDAVAVAADADFERIASHLFRGDANALAGSLDRVLDETGRAQFDDSFKGVFGLTNLPTERIDAVRDFLERQRATL